MIAWQGRQPDGKRAGGGVGVLGDRYGRGIIVCACVWFIILDLAYMHSFKLNVQLLSKYFKICFEFILMIQIIYIINFVIKIIIVKNYFDRAQLSICLVLFYNLINECSVHNYINLSWYKFVLIDYWLVSNQRYILSY